MLITSHIQGHCQDFWVKGTKRQVYFGANHAEFFTIHIFHELSFWRPFLGPGFKIFLYQKLSSNLIFHKFLSTPIIASLVLLSLLSLFYRKKNSKVYSTYAGFQSKCIAELGSESTVTSSCSHRATRCPSARTTRTHWPISSFRLETEVCPCLNSFFKLTLKSIIMSPFNWVPIPALPPTGGRLSTSCRRWFLFK